MAYIVNKTDGTAITTIIDGTIDNTNSLTLFGKSYSGFGELLNEDLVKLLENSASTAAPTAPLKGELWFDTASNQVKVYDGSAFKPTGGAKTQASAPASASEGDLWIDSDDNQLYFYSGSSWRLAGPIYTSGQTLSGWKVETINNSFGTAKVISSMYVANTRVAILSKETFIPASAITGFTTVNAGISLNSTLGASFAGETTSATYLDVGSTTNDPNDVNNIAGGNFLRSDVADTLAGRLTIQSDNGIVLGESSDLQLTITGINAKIENATQDGNLTIGVRPGGSATTPITIDGTNNRVGFFTASPTTDVEITGNVKVTGNLSITGEFENTSSGVISVDDAFIKVNTGNSEVDAGLIVETSDTDDARLFYNVSANYFTAGQGGTYSQIIRLADAVTDGDANKEKVLKTTAAGNLKVTTLTLGAVGSNVGTATAIGVDVGTDLLNATSNANTASIGQVAESISRWGGHYKVDDGSNSKPGRRYVETTSPASSDGENGDLWFVREA
jgi:hypothetical protein